MRTNEQRHKGGYKINEITYPKAWGGEQQSKYGQGLVVIRFCTSSNPTHGVFDIHNGEDLCQWSQVKIRLNTFCQSTIPQKQFILMMCVRGDIGVEKLVIRCVCAKWMAP